MDTSYVIVIILIIHKSQASLYVKAVERVYLYWGMGEEGKGLLHKVVGLGQKDL